MIATLYDTDRLQVRLPLADSQLAYLDASCAQTGLAGDTPANVLLTADYAGDTQTWSAKLLRTEGDISVKSRFVCHRGSYQHTQQQRCQVTGWTVRRCVIEGRTMDNLVSVPRTALRPDNSVMIINERNQLEFRDVSIFKLSDSDVLISEGLVSGERISTSPLQFVVEGMPVTVIN